MCTLHSFPHNIDHCLTFARSEFEGLLEKSPAEANAFLLDPVKWVLSSYACNRKLLFEVATWKCVMQVCFSGMRMGYAGIWMMQQSQATVQRVSGLNASLRSLSAIDAAPLQTA